jgi:hypothetical protein
MGIERSPNPNGKAQFATVQSTISQACCGSLNAREDAAMASDRQLIANRANAVKSKGPRSLAGKRRSSRNAMKHGLTADHTLLPGEDAEEFRGLKGAMFSSLRPKVLSKTNSWNGQQV